MRPASVPFRESAVPGEGRSRTGLYPGYRYSGSRSIAGRYRVGAMIRPTARDGDDAGTLGRSAGPATLIMSSLADGAKHGYALTKDNLSFAGVRLAPGTLYEALGRLEARGLIEALDSEDRRRPYRLTAAGAKALRARWRPRRGAAEVALRRLAGHWGTA